MIPAMKAAIAYKTGDAGWCTVRPPLVELDAGQKDRLASGLDGIGFTMPFVEDLASAN
jgi:4-hydroxy-tetrahydrodipicolinate synthase